MYMILYNDIFIDVHILYTVNIYIHTLGQHTTIKTDLKTVKTYLWKHGCIKGRRHSPDRNIWQGCGRSCCSWDRHAREDLQPDKLPAEARKVHISTWRNEWKKRCNDAMNGSIWDAEILWPLASFWDWFSMWGGTLVCQRVPSIVCEYCHPCREENTPSLVPT